jgi:hypothetical protein
MPFSVLWNGHPFQHTGDPDVHRRTQIDRIIQRAAFHTDRLISATSPCQTREPHSAQKWQLNVRPLSVERDHRFGTPRVSTKPALLTITEMPNAEADCFRHSSQWQM